MPHQYEVMRNIPAESGLMNDPHQAPNPVETGATSGQTGGPIHPVLRTNHKRHGRIAPVPSQRRNSRPSGTVMTPPSRRFQNSNAVIRKLAAAAMAMKSNMVNGLVRL